MAPVVVEKPASNDEILGLPKWVWAAIAGGVITAGIAIYIFSGDDNAGDKKKKKKKIEKSTPKATPQKKPTKVKIEDVPEEQDIDAVSFERS